MSDAAVSISQFPRHLGGVKVNGKLRSQTKKAMVKAIDWLRLDLRDHMRRQLKPQRELSKLLGQDQKPMLERIINSRGKATALNAMIYGPARKIDVYFFWGTGNLVRSPAHTYKLRAKAVKAGLFPEKIMFLPPDVPPFKWSWGKKDTFFHQRVSDVKPSKNTLQRVSTMTLSGILKAWGFDE